MKPYYLKFADEAEALAKLQEAGMLGPETPVYTSDLLRQWEEPSTDPDAEPGEMVIRQEFGERYQTGVTRYKDPALDLIGESYRNDAVYDGQTLVTPPTKRDGWFVNWIGDELPEVLVPFARTPDPATPFRVFAGWGPDEVSAVK